jgi:hypothetical protein
VSAVIAHLCEREAARLLFLWSDIPIAFYQRLGFSVVTAAPVRAGSTLMARWDPSVNAPGWPSDRLPGYF